MNILLVLGTRPEAIKMAPIVHEARRRASEGIRVQVLSTGQHRELLDPVLRHFDMQPDMELGLMRPSQTLSGLTARAIEAIDGALAELAPDVVLVQGDTTTAMAGALAAFYRGIPVGHVEAGLRTGNIRAPFPEEFNRRTIALVAKWHFPPTTRAADAITAENLPSDGGERSQILVTGNTVIDALLWTLDRQRVTPAQSEALDEARRWKSREGHYVVLVTGHRRENFGEPFREVCRALADIAEAHPEALLVYPVHLNPNVVAPVHEILGERSNIRLLPPLDYPEFTALLSESRLVITDSGGVQEEAPALGIPVIVTRDETERPEGVEAGKVRLVGPHRDGIVAAAERLLTGEISSQNPGKSALGSPYGDGAAAGRIIDFLLEKPVKAFEYGRE